MRCKALLKGELSLKATKELAAPEAPASPRHVYLRFLHFLTVYPLYKRHGLCYNNFCRQDMGH